jgi:adenine phosphoribosyltransferase
MTVGDEKMLDILKTTLEDSPVVKKGDYNYFVHPITDGVPEVSPDLLHDLKYHQTYCMR